MTRKEQAQALAQKLAAKGIYAMYGGSKGHGFWLMKAKAGDEATDARIRRGEGFAMLSAGVRMETIKNDGKRSGNEFFTMFGDAAKFAA